MAPGEALERLGALGESRVLLRGEHHAALGREERFAGGPLAEEVDGENFCVGAKFLAQLARRAQQPLAGARRTFAGGGADAHATFANQPQPITVRVVHLQVPQIVGDAASVGPEQLGLQRGPLVEGCLDGILDGAGHDRKR